MRRTTLRNVVLEVLESRVHLSVSGYRPIDEVGNNAAHPTWGTAATDLLRLAKAAYADGIDSPSLPNDQSARAISNILNNQADSSDPSEDISTVDQNSVSDFGYAFGQFMDHDMDNSPDGGAEDDIAVAANDPIGPDPLPFTRSLTDPATGTSKSNPAQQTNSVTSYLDLSQVYGSTQVVANALRTYSGGQLKTSPGNMLPYDNTTYFTTAQIAALNMENDSQVLPESSLFAAGDSRANENLELTTLETLFVRNHNTIAAELQKEHPSWGDEQLYQEARKLNIAEYQSIVYNEWIPAVLGPSALAKYTGYKPTVDAAIANEFSTVAFRFGHSMVSPTIARDGNNGQSVATPVSLAVDFFDPNLLNPGGAVDPLTGYVGTDIGAVLKGEADGLGQAVDPMTISDIRNLLFGNGVSGGQDLIALDIQRGRDHGIPSYNALRVAMGLPAVTSFAQISSNPVIQKELAEAYPGGVNTIDAFEGGLAENDFPGADEGPLFWTIMVNQFTRLRDGDRYFYLNESFNPDETAIFNGGNTLAKVIEANTNITNLQSDVFYFKASISGTVSAPTPPSSPQTPPPPPTGGPRNGPASPPAVGPKVRPQISLAGITVELEDSSGDVLATTQTNAQGNYTFTQLSGPAADPSDTPGVSGVGTYTVTILPPPGASAQQQESAPSQTVTIAVGDTNIAGVDFIAPAPPAVAPPLAR